MKSKKVIKRNNIQTSFPGLTTLSAITALKVFNAPSWLWGVVLTILALDWIGSIVSMIIEEPKDIF